MVPPHMHVTLNNREALSVARECFKILLKGKKQGAHKKLMIKSAPGEGRWAAGIGDFTVYCSAF